MRSTIARTIPIALGLTLAACSPDSNLLAPGTSPSFVNAHAEARSMHIHGTLETTEWGGPIPGTPFLLRHLEGSGIATHLGRFTVEGTITLNLATASGTGTGSYTAANGDVLTVSSTGQAVLASGIATVTETVTITGGTGRFEGATGGFIVVRRVVQATGVSTGTIDGTVTLQK